ncbi:MAG TPA: AAA family ATPase [Candidatus Saccharimonadales bacterium]|nr:AAA family ATPase [Candidatus Saccharimonadales bacterium]
MRKPLQLIGISGTNGSGKDTLGQILAEDYDWLFVSVSDLLRDEARRRNLPIERQNLRKISAEWRREFGLGILMDKAVEVFKATDGKYAGLVISNLRNAGEADEIHQLGGKVVWVDADPKLRYQRVSSRSRSAEDQKTFDQFLKEEEDEMHEGGDAATLSMSAVKAKSDIFLTNNDNDLEGFKLQIKSTLNL